MSLQALIAFAIYAVIVAVVGFVLIWVSDRYAPAELQAVLRGAIIVICVLLILMRLAGFV